MKGCQMAAFFYLTTL